MTTQDLDARLRSAIKDAATTLVPSVGTAVPLGFAGKRAARRRPQLWAGAGVVATAAAVAIGLVVTSADNPAPRVLPSSSAAVSLGPVVTHLPYRPAGLTTWSSGVSFSSSLNGWALGTWCASTKQRKCPTILAHTVDAGRSWTFAPSTAVLAKAVAVLAGSKGIWAITGSSNTLWFSDNDGHTWTKLFNAAIAGSRVVNGRLVAYVHGGPDLAVSPCTVKVSRVVYDGATRISDEHLSDDVLGGETAAEVGLDGSIWRSRSNTHACSHGMVVNGSLKTEVAPPGKDFGGLHNPPSPSTGAWDLAALSGSTAQTLVGNRVVETTDAGITWKTVGSIPGDQPGPEFFGLAGNRLLVDNGGFETDLDVQVRDAAGRLTAPLAVGSAPAPPPSTTSFSYDQPTLDAVVNPTSTEVGLLFAGRFVLSTDAGRTWHLQGTLPS